MPGQEHQERQRGAQHRHPDVVDRGRARGPRGKPAQADAQHAVEHRGERGQHPSCTTTAATNHTAIHGHERVAGHDRRGVPGDGERRAATDGQVRPAPAPYARSVAVIRRSGTRSSGPTWCCARRAAPGRSPAPGTRGRATSGAPLTADGEQRVGVQHLARRQRGLRERAAAPASAPRADAGAGTPASAARSRRRTPVQVWVVDQPSTHAIGSVAVCCGMRAAGRRRSSRTGAGPPVSSSRQPSPTAGRRRCPDTAKVLLTGKSFGPPSAGGGGAPAGQQERQAAQRAADRLARRHRRDQQRPAADQRERAAAADRRRAGVGGDQAVLGSGSSGWVCASGVRSSPRSDRERSAAHHVRQLEHDVRDERRRGTPRPRRSGRVEAEAEHVVVLDVQQAGDDLEQDAADEQQQRRAAPAPARASGPAASANSFGTTDHSLASTTGHEHHPEPDVQALGEPVEPRRRGRPVEPGQVQRRRRRPGSPARTAARTRCS